MQTQIKTCPRCGEQVPYNATFCMRCAYNFVPPVSAPPVSTPPFQHQPPPQYNPPQSQMSYQQAVPRDGQAGAITSIAVGVIAGILYFVPAGATAFNITLAVLMLVLSITGLIMGILSLRTKSKAAGIVGIIVSFIPLALLGLAFLGGFMQGVQEGLNSGNGSSSSQSAGSQQ